MSKRYIIAANWKMNKTIEESKNFVEKFNNLLLDIPSSKVIFCPPFFTLFYMNELLQDSPYSTAAQNMHWEDKGAYTGEVSANMLTSSGISHVIIGHSERRHLFGETDANVNLKIQKALKSLLTPIMCVGETLEDRKNGNTLTVLRSQIKTGLKDIASGVLSNIIFAYEPVWAIGTGERAEPKQIDEAHRTIRSIVKSLGAKDNFSILYGGSVKSSNVNELLNITEVNGFLIGGASLDAKEFVSIIQQTETYIK